MGELCRFSHDRGVLASKAPMVANTETPNCTGLSQRSFYQRTMPRANVPPGNWEDEARTPDSRTSSKDRCQACENDDYGSRDGAMLNGSGELRDMQEYLPQGNNTLLTLAQPDMVMKAKERPPSKLLHCIRVLLTKASKEDEEEEEEEEAKRTPEERGDEVASFEARQPFVFWSSYYQYSYT